MQVVNTNLAQSTYPLKILVFSPSCVVRAQDKALDMQRRYIRLGGSPLRGSRRQKCIREIFHKRALFPF